jgi:DNA-binding response OmpR family regulator
VTHKILIVDDEPNMLKMLGMTLEAAGFQIIVAQEAKSAWKKIADEAPDLVVLDIMMPGMDGLEFLRRLRLQPVTELLPVILLSALSAVDDKIAGLKAGADEYLTKPIDPREFVARITALLERTERLRESSSEQSAIIVSVIGVKGGVGTTRVASNIAGVLTTVNRQTGTIPGLVGRKSHRQVAWGRSDTHQQQDARRISF